MMANERRKYAAILPKQFLQKKVLDKPQGTLEINALLQE